MVYKYRENIESEKPQRKKEIKQKKNIKNCYKEIKKKEQEACCECCVVADFQAL